jgi:hypothetical protein
MFKVESKDMFKVESKDFGHLVIASANKTKTLSSVSKFEKKFKGMPKQEIKFDKLKKKTLLLII